MKYNCGPAGLFLALLAPICHAEIASEFLLFPHAEAIFRPDLTGSSVLSHH